MRANLLEERQPLVWRVYVGEIRREINAFREYLIRKCANQEDIPISDIFQMLPFGPMGGNTRDDLIARGSIAVSNGSMRNIGDEVIGDFTDANFGQIAILFDETLAASYTVRSSSLAIDFPNPVPFSFFKLAQLPGDLRGDIAQELTKIVATESAWYYHIRAEANHADTITLVVDLADGPGFADIIDMDQSAPILGSAHLPSRRSVVGFARSASLRANCCGGGDPCVQRVNRRTQIEEVRLHIRVLVPPTIAIANMIADMTAVYQSIGLRVNVVTNQNVNNPALNTVNVGTCTMGGAIPAQLQQLYNLATPPANELAVFFLQATNPPLNGCAMHPPNQPGCVVTQIASRWTLAHEVGHVLGLAHTANSDDLMFGGGTNNITNPPADLSAAENNTMRSSPFTIPV